MFYGSNAYGTTIYGGALINVEIFIYSPGNFGPFGDNGE